MMPCSQDLNYDYHNAIITVRLLWIRHSLNMVEYTATTKDISYFLIAKLISFV